MAGNSVLTFRRCECGVEFKIVASPDGKKQNLSCECGRQHTVVGTVIDVYRGEGHVSSERDWVKVSREKIRELPSDLAKRATR